MIWHIAFQMWSMDKYSLWHSVNSSVLNSYRLSLAFRATYIKRKLLGNYIINNRFSKIYSTYKILLFMYMQNKKIMTSRQKRIYFNKVMYVWKVADAICSTFTLNVLSSSLKLCVSSSRWRHTLLISTRIRRLNMYMLWYIHSVRLFIFVIFNFEENIFVIHHILFNY